MPPAAMQQPRIPAPAAQTRPAPAGRASRASFSVAFALVLAAGLALFGLVVLRPAPARTEGPGIAAPVVEVVPVVWQERYVMHRSYLGRVEARQSSPIGFEVPGSVSEVLFEEGERVEAGALVARLDTQRLDALRRQLDAEVRRAEARLLLAESTLERTRDARAQEAVSEQLLDEAEQEASAARAGLEGARAALFAVDVDLEKSELRSPFAARVAERFVDAGRVVQAGEPVLLLLEEERPEVRLGLAGPALEAVAVGASLRVEVRGASYLGRVQRILPLRDARTRDVDVVVALEASFGELRSGDLARASFRTSIEEPGFWVPLQALTEGTRGLWSVYLLEEAPGRPARLLRTDVELLHQESVDGERAFVRAPLEGGAKIVARGLNRLANRMEVRAAALVEGEGGLRP